MFVIVVITFACEVILKIKNKTKCVLEIFTSLIHLFSLKWKMVHLYSAFIQSALHRLCITFTHSHSHPYTDAMAEETMQGSNLLIGSN